MIFFGEMSDLQIKSVKTNERTQEWGIKNPNQKFGLIG